jgi:TolA-binding protein
MKKKTGSIMDMKGCIPKLDHVVTIEEMDEGIRRAVREDWMRFERQSRGEALEEEIEPQ